jgi:uroporphyrinogen decarboxylase
MEKPMGHRARMEALLDHTAVDQIPVSFWRHFPVDDQYANKLAAATIQFQNTFDFDFIKVSPASSFCIKDWGVQDEWKGNPEGTRDYFGSVVHTPEDWGSLQVLDPHKGFLGKQLESLRLLKKEYGSRVPIIQTIFSPLAQAKHLAASGMLLNFLHENPEELKSGLDVITRTTIEFISACKEIGIDGVYYAIQHASYELLNPAELNDFQVAFDRKLFPQISEFWLNVLHIHGTTIMADKIAAADYPVQIVNWHDRETSPDLKDGTGIFAKALSGGLGRMQPMLLGEEKAIKSMIDDAVSQTQGRNFILGTGCVLMQATPYGNIRFATDYVRSIPV